MSMQTAASVVCMLSFSVGALLATETLYGLIDWLIGRCLLHLCHIPIVHVHVQLICCAYKLSMDMLCQL